MLTSRQTQATTQAEGDAFVSDPINHPDHYAAGRKYEPIDVIEDWGLDFNIGNTVKYISRAGRKGDVLEDLLKARWYLERAIGRLMPDGVAK